MSILQQRRPPETSMEGSGLPRQAAQTIISRNHARLASTGFVRQAHFGGFFFSGAAP